MTRAVLFAISMTACAPKSPTPGGVRVPDLVGVTYRDGMTDIGAPLSWSGESLVGAGSGLGITWGRHQQSGGLLVLVSRLVEEATDGGPPLWQVVDAQELPALPRGAMLQTLSCSVAGRPDPWVIGVIRASGCEVAEASAAWRVTDDGRLQPVIGEAVTCPCEPDEPGGVFMGVEGGS